MRAIQTAFFKIAGFIIGVALLAQIVAGSEVQINYNKERAAKARSKFWQGAIKLARNIGDVRKAFGGNQ